jgi:NADH-quinone oxidoreductase subunit J
MFPPGSRWRRAAGVVLGAISLGLLASLVPALTSWAERSVFWILAGITLFAAGATVVTRSPIYSAIWFAFSVLTTAGLFLIAGAQFLAVATVIVYAGAIVVTILFVLMLAQPEGHAFYDRVSWGAFPAAAASLAAAAIVGMLTLMTVGVAHGPFVGDVLEEYVDDRGQPRISPEQLRSSRFAVDPATRRPTLQLELWEEVEPLSELEEYELQQLLTSHKIVSLAPKDYEVVLCVYAPEVLAEEHVARLGGELLGHHLISVEVAGVLLLVALVGAVVIVIQGRGRQLDEGGPGDA